LPIDELKVAINKIEVCEIIKQELVATKYLLEFKNSQISNLDSTLIYYKNKEIKYLQLVENLKKINTNYQKNIFNNTARIEYQEKQIRKKNRHKFIYGILGFVLGVLIL
jgi:nitrogen fixation/metabolism regulation signal transduction histidine kinase